MKLSIAFLALATVCGAQQPTAHAHKQTPQHSNVFVQLGDYAASRGIRFLIVCTSDDQHESYFAWAIQPHAQFSLYIEDGAKDDWSKSEFSSRESAAQWLLGALRGAPNMKAEHRESDKPQKKKRCLSPVTSENYKERHDLSCPECGK